MLPAGAYGNESQHHCLYKWVCEQSRNNGIFDSSVVDLSKRSRFRREEGDSDSDTLRRHSKQKRFSSDSTRRVRLREANFVSPAHIVSANSAKTCYSAFSARVTGTSKPSSAFEMGDAYRNNNGNPDDSAGSACTGQTTKNAVKARRHVD